MLKDLKQVGPSNGVEGLGNVHLQKDGGEFLAVKSLTSQLHRSEVVMYGPTFDESTLVWGHHFLETQSQPTC